MRPRAALWLSLLSAACSRPYSPPPARAPVVETTEAPSLPYPILFDAPLHVAGQPIKHVIPTEAVANVAVPVYIEIPSSVGVAAATVHYKPFGSSYSKVEMQRLGPGFAVEIPCGRVTGTGMLRMFITLTDIDGKSLGSLGDESNPFHIMMKYELHGAWPKLPGRPAPRRCGECKFGG